jgi:hypothetical protein
MSPKFIIAFENFLSRRNVFGPFPMTALRIQTRLRNAYPELFPPTMRDYNNPLDVYSILINERQRVRITEALHRLDELDPIITDPDGLPDPDLEYLTACFKSLPDENEPGLQHGFCL